MSEQLVTEAQELVVIDPSMAHNPPGMPLELVPLEVVDFQGEHDMAPMEISEPHEIEIVVEELPGAPSGTKDPEPVLEVSEESEKSDEDNNDAKKSKKNEKWDWESKGAQGFVAWIKDKVDGVPKHSGYDSAGIERAISYMEKLDNEISRAMRLDLDGELDADKIEQVRSKIDEGVSRLHDRLDKVRKNKKQSRKKRSDDQGNEIVKEAQKILGIQGTYITVPLLISGIARVCINGTVSAGHDMEQIYKDQVKKYKLNDREKSEVRWLLYDMGYALRGDRGFMPEEEFDSSSSDNYDYMANYKG